MSTAAPHTYTGVIYDPDEGSRMRLKSATMSVSDFGAVSAGADEHDAMLCVDRHQRVDLIFLSEKIAADRIQRFIETSKQNPKAELASFIIVKSSTLGGITAPGALLLGADGIICEPFSVEALMEIIALARRLSRERELVHRRLGATLLVTDLISQIDAAAYLKAQGTKAVSLERSMRQLREKARELAEEQPEIYFDVLVRLLEKAKPMQGELKTRLYQGASNAVRRRVETKLLHEIAALQKPEDEEEA